MSFVRRTSLTFLFALVAVAAIASPAVLAAPFDAGLRFGAQANEADLGLPLFPGAQVQRDDKEDKAAVRMDLWGGAFGLRMAVGKFKVAAKPEELQTFYAKALAAHGAVLNCKGPAPKAEKRKDKGRDAPLTCDDTRAEGIVLKVGSERNQRHVAIQAKGDETHFQIVRIEMKGD